MKKTGSYIDHKTHNPNGHQFTGRHFISEQQTQTKKSDPSRHSRHGMSLGSAMAIDVLVAALIVLLYFIRTLVFVPHINGSELPATTKPENSTYESFPEATTENIRPSQTGSTTVTPPATTAPTKDNSWRVKFADQFTSGAVYATVNSYKSANISLSIKKVQDGTVVYYIADIYVADLKYFRTAFAKSPGDVLGYREYTDVIAKEQNAILAINGDHCLDNKGFIVRNGKLYDQTASNSDALIMYADGSMQTLAASELDISQIISRGVYQAWTFGPMLLKDGQPMTQFNTTVSGANPRTAMGYYEPGHYCLVVVDGRQPGYSTGYTMQQLSQLFYNLGCKVAFNLDGGQSTEMVYYYDDIYGYINKPYHNGRTESDIVFIADT
jgi:exopolysaccharide biosynthesis protein